MAKFGDTIDALDKYKGGIAQTADLWSGAFSTVGNGGPYTQVYFGNSEITPEGFGLGTAAAQARGGQPSKLATMLAKTLEITCRETNIAACGLRFTLPGLPPDPVTKPPGTSKTADQLNAIADATDAANAQAATIQTVLGG